MLPETHHPPTAPVHPFPRHSAWGVHLGRGLVNLCVVQRRVDRGLIRIIQRCLPLVDIVFEYTYYIRTYIQRYSNQTPPPPHQCCWVLLVVSRTSRLVLLLCFRVGRLTRRSTVMAAPVSLSSCSCVCGTIRGSDIPASRSPHPAPGSGGFLRPRRSLSTPHLRLSGWLYVLA